MADSNLEYSREMDSVIEDNYVYDSKTKSWTQRAAGVLRRRAEGYRQSIDAFVKDAVTSDDGELSAKGTELFFGGRCDKVQSALQQLPAGSRLFGGGNADGFWSTKGERSSTKHEARHGPRWPDTAGGNRCLGGPGCGFRDHHPGNPGRVSWRLGEPASLRLRAPAANAETLNYAVATLNPATGNISAPRPNFTVHDAGLGAPWCVPALAPLPALCATLRTHIALTATLRWTKRRARTSSCPRTGCC